MFTFRLLRLTFTSCAALSIAGCASSELTLNLDLYTEDVSRSAPLSEAEISVLLRSLDGIQQEASDLVSDRLALAERFADAYVEFFVLATTIAIKRENPAASAGEITQQVQRRAGSVVSGQ